LLRERDTGQAVAPSQLTLATIGMRRGEVLGLAWDDLDLASARLSVHWTLGVVKAKPTWKRQPKSRAGQRTMALARPRSRRCAPTVSPRRRSGCSPDRAGRR
ncbi:MAG: hypothetical protein M3N52_09125, partial [Actinomycetota bacterium]|nr:hypothetical protein [Actinomycetota bacterium]